MKEQVDNKSHRPKRWLWRFGFFVILIVSSGLWLNGPGFRWLAPRVASHYASKAGVKVDFDVRGSLLNGFSISEVEIVMADSPVKRLAIRELTPGYRVSRLIRGEIESVTTRGVHLEVELDGDANSEPINFSELNTKLREVRARVVALGFDLSEVTAVIDGPGMPQVEVALTAARHQAGTGIFLLDLGLVKRGGDILADPQAIVIDWTDDRLAVDRVALQSDLVITDLVLAHPADGGFFAEGVVEFAGAVFHLTSVPEQSTLALHLREGALDADRVGELLNIDLPVAGTLTSFVLNAAELSPDPMAATATLSLLVENFIRDDLTIDELNLDVILDHSSVRLVARATSGVAEARIDATTTIDREAMALVETNGVFAVPSLVALTDQFALLPEDLPPLPTASVNADFTVVWGEGNSPVSVNATAELVPDEVNGAPGFRLMAEWEDGGQVVAAFLADGLKLDAALDWKAKRYSGEVHFDGFESARFATWLAAVGVAMPGDAEIDATWRGNGPLGAHGHVGELVLASGVWIQQGQPDVDLTANVSYALPERISVSDVNVVRDGQTIDARVELADGLLEIHQLRWTDADATEMADASGSLPMPKDFGAWRKFLIEDTRPLALVIRTRTLDFEKLAAWVPALAAVDARTTAELVVLLGGTFAAPDLDASLKILGLKAVDRPALPPADIMLKARGYDGELVVDGSITTPDFAPAVLSAKLPFAPAAWADDIETLTGADFEASAVLPRLDLSRFAALIPAARSATGIVTGIVRASGALGKPVLAGRLELAGGSIRLVNDSLPQITGITAVAEFDLDRATLKSLRATIAGGTLDVAGALIIDSRELDFRIRGNSLPLVRNESLIVRTNADLRVAGPIDRATVSGSVSLVDSLLFRDIEILPIGMPFIVPGAAALPKIDTALPTEAIPEPFAKWPLDVRLSTADPILIRGNLATGSILADIHVGGTLADPRPNGTVRLLRGRAVLPFSTLAIPEATLTFTPANGLDPVIEARGTAEPRPYTVNLFAYGRLSDPQIVLASNPPLPRNEIMTLLATGTTTRGLENPQMASARAIQLFAEEVRRGRVPMGNQLRPLLGVLDRVDFTLAETDPYSSDTYSTATLKLHDRWYLSAGMGNEGNTRMFAIWRLRFR